LARVIRSMRRPQLRLSAAITAGKTIQQTRSVTMGFRAG
jgi:hypothetical protein